MPSLSRNVIVIGASSGGLEGLLQIIPQLPRDLPAAIFVVVHVPSQAKSHLPEILSRAGRLPAMHAQDKEEIKSGRIYIAPPDFNLLLTKGYVRVLRGPRENNHRPAIDPLFRTAARTFGSRVVGVLLSGTLDDGVAGLFAIKRRGGVALVQDPADALFPDLPRNAMRAVPVDYCLGKREIAKTLIDLTASASGEQGAIMPRDNGEMEKETDIEAFEEEALQDEVKPGNPSPYGCPDCGGVLWEIQDNDRVRFRCRVGHAFSADGLLRNQGESLESALWSAFRILHENAALSRRLSDRARGNNNPALADKFERKSRVAAQHAGLIRELLLSGQIKAEIEAEQS